MKRQISVNVNPYMPNFLIGRNMNESALIPNENKKIAKYVLIGLGIILAFFIVRSFMFPHIIKCYKRQIDGNTTCYKKDLNTGKIVQDNVPCDSSCIPEGS